MYVESANNPADILTRQPKAKDLLINKCWWNGPEFLSRSRDQWPIQNPAYNLMPEETMKADENVSTPGNNIPNLIELSKAAKTKTEKEFLESELYTLQLSAQIQGNSEPIDFEGFPDPQINHHKTGEVDWKRFKSFKHILGENEPTNLYVCLFAINFVYFTHHQAS